ncbi:MAG TPA: 3-hydroxyacyl-CoA dehydrogenase [Porticoccaceae bacterium]|nr:3-hydroxyacyl-CoA dehydrogenase [Porticoccaceae bacterium]
MDLAGKVAVVTGGASGLGRATTEVLAGRGARIAIFDLNEEAGAEVVKALGEDNAAFWSVNVASAESVEGAVAEVVERFGRIDVLINCAGIGPAEKIINREGEPMPLDGFANLVAINLTGSFNVARCCAAAMAKNELVGGERGVIIHTASVAAYEGQVGQCAYSATKGGVVGMTLPMARDLASYGIRVNTIAPGIMGTPLLRGMPQKVQDSLAATVPNPARLGEPDEYGRLAAHIVENAYINGETIRIDGAIRMQPR